MMGSESFDINGDAERRVSNVSITPVFAIVALFLDIFSQIGSQFLKNKKKM